MIDRTIGVFYLDASAAAKLVLEEEGSAALRVWIDVIADRVVSSDLLRTELLRAIRRHAPEQIAQGHAILESMRLLGLSRNVFERAAELEPGNLRSLDAIHISAAIEFGGDELEGIITYDDRMADGARSVGIAVVAPT